MNPAEYLSSKNKSNRVLGADALQYGDKKNNPAFNEDPSRNIA